MRRSSSTDRTSFGPLRVKQDENVKASSRNGRSSASGSSRQSTGNRSLSGNRASVGGRPSISTARKSIQPGNRFGQQKRLSRGSGMGMRGASKDILPVSNKSFQSKCAQNVLQFLTDRGYPHQLPAKALQSPTTKDFHKIFEFVYGFVSPHYKVPTVRPEEEIPRIFKMVGFPVMISRSSMFAIGSPHTWPTILAALSFLVDWISYGIGINDRGEDIMFMQDDDVFDGASDDQLFNKYLEHAYIAFLEGSDTFEEEEAILKEKITRKAQADEGSVASTLQETTAMENQLELLEGDTDRLKTAQQKLEILQHDQERFASYIGELETLKKKLTQEASDGEVNCANLVEELESVNARMLKMQLIFESQEFTPEDVERINQRRRQLARQRDDVEARCQTVDEEIWREEVAMTKEMEQMEGKCQQYNKLAYNLKLIPVSAENSCGVDYEMKKPSMTDDADCWDFNSTIKPALFALKAQVAESTNLKESEKIKLTEKLEQAQDCVSDVQNEVSLMESKCKRTEDEFEAKKQLYQKKMSRMQETVSDIENEMVQLKPFSPGDASSRLLQIKYTQIRQLLRSCLIWLYQKEMSRMQETVSDMENEMVQLNSVMFISETDAGKEKKQLAQWAAKEKEKCQRKVQEYSDFFKSAMQICMDHMDAVQVLISGAAERSEKLKAEALQKAQADT